MSSFNPLFFEKMSIQYESLLESGQRSDVVLVAGDKELRAHKLVLSTRSPVFSAMFAHDSTKEAQENRVEMIDVDVEVLELFVRYIYTGKVDMLEEYAVELLVIADMYQVASLKSICERQLMSKEITTELASDLLILADMYQATELIAKCLDFITDNVTRVMATEGWKKVRAKPDLVDDLFKLLNSKYLSKVIDGEKKANLIPRQNTIPFNMASFGSLIFEEMSEQYESLLKSGKLSDVVLVVSDKELKVHKVVISVRSPVFDTMFENESTKEAQETRVEIVDIDLEVLEMLVRYIYTGKIEQLDQYTAELLAVADKYQIDCLKTVCEQQILSQLNVESVSKLLILADMHQLTEWYNKCVDFINDNSTQVIASEEWKKKNIVGRIDLMANLYEHLHLKYSKVMNVDKEKAELVKKNDEKISEIDRILPPDHEFEMYLLKNSNVINCKEEMMDGVLIVGDKELKVHKKVLSARSPVFAGIFAGHVSNKEIRQESRVQITDINVKVLKLLIKYIYTGKVEALDRHSTAKLFAAADKFQVDCLKSICEHKLLSQLISIKSVSDLLILGHMYKVTELYNKCLDYFASNVTQVMASEGWKRVRVKVDLLANICDRFNLDISKQLHLCPLNVESVLYLLILADMHQVTELTTKCLDYIATNRTRVIASKGWMKIVVRANLLAKICVHLNLDISEQLLLCPINVESLSDLLILADVHQVTELTTNCLEYIIDNVNQVTQEKDLKKIVMRDDLLAKLYELLSLKYTRVLDEQRNEQMRIQQVNNHGYNYGDNDDYDDFDGIWYY